MNNASRYKRQSFLGSDSQKAFESCTIAIVGLGGGGSHIVQQLAHIGFRKYVLFDPDIVEESNLNRLIGATSGDVEARTPKVHVATRLIKSLQSEASIQPIQDQWQQSHLPLRSADIIFGCVDGFAQRAELEACARRFLIPLIDIGIDVNTVEGEPPQLAGQVILSMPNMPCMKCLGLLGEKELTAEAGRYGQAGDHPQVVWANGVVASTAVGMCVDLLTNWSTQNRQIVYLSYYGNAGTVQPHPKLKYINLEAPCPHYPLSHVGEPRFTKI